MLLQQSSKEFRKLFLLEFTRQLIKSTDPSAFYELEKQVKEEEIEEKEKIKNIIKKKEILRKPLFVSRKREIGYKPLPRVLRIPEPRLPRRLQYLRPTATSIYLDLGKLNNLLKDSAVQVIECNGSEQKINVRIPQLKQTNIILTKEEIDEVILKIEKESKIPTDKGFYRVALGNLIFSAIISDMTGSKFIIKKIPIQRSNPKRGMREFHPMR